MIASKKLVLLLSVVAVAGVAWKGVDLLTRPPAVPAPSPAPSVSVPAARQRSADAPPARLVSANASKAAPPRAASSDIEQMVQAAAGDPDKSFMAFQKIQNCLTLENDKEVVDDVDVKVNKKEDGVELQVVEHKVGEPALQALRKSCTGLTGRTRLDRFQLLTYALDHHVPGALAVYIMAGPNGDREALLAKPNDPVFAAWRDDALKRLDERIAAGYPDALMLGSTGYQLLGRPQAPADEYMERLAANKILGAINGDDGIYSKDFMDAWSRDFSEQQKNDAQAQADRIFQAWKTRKATVKQA